jgi:hypothetical protein
MEIRFSTSITVAAAAAAEVETATAAAKVKFLLKLISFTSLTLKKTNLSWII